MRRDDLRLLALLLPAGVFFGAFFLLPLARLFLVGGSGRSGFAAYAAIITDRNHFNSLLATLALAAATTVVTLIVSGLAGVFLQRNKFPGNAALVAMLTLPLPFHCSGAIHAPRGRGQASRVLCRDRYGRACRPPHR